MTIYELLTSDEDFNLPVAYGYHSTEQHLPYICLMGAGQDTFAGDDTFIYKQDRTQIELYFKKKNPAIEQALESLLLENGYLYEKSEDVYIEDEDVFMIYYDV